MLNTTGMKLLLRAFGLRCTRTDTGAVSLAGSWNLPPPNHNGSFGVAGPSESVTTMSEEMSMPTPAAGTVKPPARPEGRRAGGPAVSATATVTVLSAVTPAAVTVRVAVCTVWPAVAVKTSDGFWAVSLPPVVLSVTPALAAVSRARV